MVRGAAQRRSLVAMTNGWKALIAGSVLLVPLVALVDAGAQSPPVSSPPGTPLVAPAPPPPLPPGISPSRDPSNLYAETGAGMISPAAAGAIRRVYVPTVSDNMIYVIDPATMKVVDRYPVPGNPQHVIPSWDLKTLWVASSAPSRNVSGSRPPDRPDDREGRQADRRARRLQHVLHARWRFRRDRGGDDGRARVPRSADHEAARDARHRRLRRPQSRRLLARRPLRDLHLRVRRRRTGQGRHGPTQGRRQTQVRRQVDAAGHSFLP